MLTDVSMMTMPPSNDLRAAWFIVQGIAAENPLDRPDALGAMITFMKSGHNLPEPLRNIDFDKTMELVNGAVIPDVDLVVPVNPVNGIVNDVAVSLKPLFFHVGDTSTAHYLVAEADHLPVDSVLRCYRGIKRMDVDDIIVHSRRRS